MTGRYSWDSYTFYQSLRKMQQLVYKQKPKEGTMIEQGEEDVEDHLTLDPRDFDEDPCRYLGIAPEMKLSEDVDIEDRPRVLTT